MKNGYTITYEPQTVAGEHGWWYSVSANGRVVFEGWSRGRKMAAEIEVREGIRSREALRSLAGIA